MILEFFFFTFPKKWVGRAMGNETFYGDGLKSVYSAKKEMRLSLTLILVQIVTYIQTKKSREKHEKLQIVSSLK